MPAQSNIQIKIGADPELFVVDSKGDFVSAYGLIPGTKEKPHQIPYGAIQVDGVAAEFNIEPAMSRDQFINGIAQVLQQLEHTYLPKGYSLKTVPSVKFTEAIWNNIPNVSKELGCNPDYNAWTGLINEPPTRVIQRLCTGAGHIHIGWTSGANCDPGSNHFEDCRVMVKQLDYYIGMYSLGWDTDSRRRTLYGKAGAFRPKPYGVEYRTPSNMWLKSQQLQSWIYDAAYTAAYGLFTGEREVMEERYHDLARTVIDGNQTDYIKGEFKSEAHTFTGLPWPKW